MCDRKCSFCICILATLLVLAQGDKTLNGCIDQKSCGTCLGAGPDCGWCTQENFSKKSRNRCDLVNNLLRARCDDSYIVRPKTEIVYDKNLGPRNAELGKEAVQLSPQEVTLRLRPNDPYRLTVNFKQAENYPVDLYFVMDLSQSMDDDKTKLGELGDALAERMQEITRDFHLGFGSFVDKKTMPYVSMIPSDLEHPCKGCHAPYGFKNQLSLTDDKSQFRVQVEDAPISGNLDHPEGGFDALMQAIVCKTQIGWRPRARHLIIYSSDAGLHFAGAGKNRIGWRKASRKMLLYSTDAGFHFAGDGKIGGIVDPNDGKCHLDSDGFYSESLNQDYPSISQLAQKIEKENVNVIFAVTEQQLGLYKMVSKFFEGSVVGVLRNDSSNVVDLVQKNYQKISSIVKLKTEGDDDVNVSFRTKCTGTEWRDKANCEGVGIGQNVSYEVSIEVTSCPEDRSQWRRKFDIYAIGLTEKLTVNLDLICECECEKPAQESRSSAKCSRKGTFECGACTCDSGYYGKQCECDGSELGSIEYDATCKMSNTSTLVCEGNGQCVCGECDCFPIGPDSGAANAQRYSGAYCQCNDYSCDYFDNQLCGGPTRGKCVCGICQCVPGFMNSNCDCPISNETCMATAKKGEEPLLCNGKGTCLCGRCTCDIDDVFRGPTCEDCPTCQGKCEQNRACVQCRTFQTGELSAEHCEANCTHIEVVESVEESEQWRRCSFRDEDNCLYYFIYDYGSDEVKAQETRECQEPVKIWAIILFVIFGILLIGLALLIMWKILVTIVDRRELAEFEKAQKNLKWPTEQNPIFKQATTTTMNPLYAQN